MFGYGNARMFVSAARRAVDNPLSETAPEVETEYWEIMLPISNVLAPLSVTDSEIGALGCTDASRSAQRPPHPVVGGWSGMDVCHCVCWSAWENNCGGNSMAPARYWARVTGNTSV